MKLSVNLYKRKIEDFYFGIEGYDYRDDITLSYQEAVLIDWILKHPNQETIETEMLDGIGLRSPAWWEDCVARFYGIAVIEEPWNKVLVDKRLHRLCDTVYDKYGTRIPWSEREEYKAILKFEKDYFGGRKQWK